MKNVFFSPRNRRCFGLWIANEKGRHLRKCDLGENLKNPRDTGLFHKDLYNWDMNIINVYIMILVEILDIGYPMYP